MYRKPYVLVPRRSTSAIITGAILFQTPHWCKLCCELSTRIYGVQECCIKDDSRSIVVALHVEATNHLSVLV
jgi:hypothetical protein